MEFEILNKIVRQIKVSHPLVNEFKFKLQFLLRKFNKKPHEDHLFFLSYLKLPKPEKEYTFIDIGANRGQTIQSVLNLKNFKLISFEPLKNLSDRLTQRYKKNNNVTIFNNALANIEEKMPVYIPYYNNVAFDGLCSLNEKEALKFFDVKRFIFFDENLLEIRKSIVNVSKLDSFDINCDFLKADVQGQELNTLKGSVETIKRCEPFIILERPSLDKEVAFLQNFNYSPYVFKNGKFKKEFKSYNVIFMMNKHRKLFDKSLFE
ncbi:FkbM family methyltransferase [Prochlorococcus marinus XMU1414]|uniref:FkbM family methyltransferase n=1 Tax=Prochlorococcus marinus XMU1424 TaxID=2774497 RepID=A0A9D9BYQ8_PROMR|nr:FkbM family methyltransferase [Prochlorococcus marinus]MBO8228673.1 FkbM family methyltransferase [Prochlorococcus marinus XMU1414]MBW3046152.1 hypothetical protein [Prochlorococcus marinus str. MU1414]MCR8531556.1 FkbM family methyltransferase [Prochlorococcus marinus XMU1420]MCR8535285.1 FkbM family methyltransferase [Prochlorococcus marinus XMU1424]